MTKYKKPFLTIDEQISLLEKRGLIVVDKEKAKFYLKNISYYHLSIYAKAFQDKSDIFNKDTTFEEVLDLYNFDKKLRLLLLDVLERIEMSFKCVLTHEIAKSKGDNCWYTKGENFQNGEEDIVELLDKTKGSDEIYIQHYYKNYLEPPYPPAWMFFESLTFGKCSRLARNLYDTDKQIIASFYRLPKKTAIQMFYYLSHLRNVCAHHSRVWNRGFVIKVAKYKKYKDLFDDLRDDSLYTYLITIQILLKKISPTSLWLEKLDDLISKYNIPIHRMGFPKDWRIKLEGIK